MKEPEIALFSPLFGMMIGVETKLASLRTWVTSSRKQNPNATISTSILPGYVRQRYRRYRRKRLSLPRRLPLVTIPEDQHVECSRLEQTNNNTQQQQKESQARRCQARFGVYMLLLVVTGMAVVQWQILEHLHSLSHSAEERLLFLEEIHVALAEEKETRQLRPP